jgi:hypothetical protein
MLERSGVQEERVDLFNLSTPTGSDSVSLKRLLIREFNHVHSDTDRNSAKAPGMLSGRKLTHP